MFEHLVDLEVDFEDAQDASVDTLLTAQASSAAPLFDPNAGAELLTDLQRAAAQNAFTAVTDPNAAISSKKDAVLSLRTPVAVAHLTTMLDKYDWEFVDHARQIRGYVVSKLLEETTHPDARIRLRALELTGKITEVASFTERSEVIKRDVSTSELEERIKSRLDKFARLLSPQEDVETIETAVVVRTAQKAPPIDTPTKGTP